MKLLELTTTLDHTEKLLAKLEDFLHHIAEEELIACKVFSIRVVAPNVLAFIVDCNDEKRALGFQADLSKKLHARLKLHPQVDNIKPKIYHKNIDPR